jgi:hypothetical protein
MNPEQLPGSKSTPRSRGGRPRGSLNRRSLAALEAIRDLGFDQPHVRLMKLGNDENVPASTQITALAAAAPFVAPRLAPRPEQQYNEKQFEITPPRTADDALSILGSLMVRTANGELGLQVVNTLSDLLRLFVSTLAGGELEKRLAALERGSDFGEFAAQLDAKREASTHPNERGLPTEAR